MPEDDDFATELSGEDEEPMNVKHPGVLPAIVVGLVVSVGQYYWSRAQNRSDQTESAVATALAAQGVSMAELKTQVSILNAQVNKLAEQPYVRRDEFQNGISGLNERIGNLERAVLIERKR